MTPTLRIILALAAFGLARAADAATVTLQWDSNRERDIAGYLVSYGTQSGQLTRTADAGNHTSYQFTDLETGRTYFFAIRAYNTAGQISTLSPEVSATIGARPLGLQNFITNLPPPQPAGSTVIFAAAATGGSPPYQYRWSVWDGVTLIVIRDWSGDNTFTWQPSAPNVNYTVKAWARNATINGNPAYAVAEHSMQFAITPGAAARSEPPPLVR